VVKGKSYFPALPSQVRVVHRLHSGGYGSRQSAFWSCRHVWLRRGIGRGVCRSYFGDGGYVTHGNLPELLIGRRRIFFRHSSARKSPKPSPLFRRYFKREEMKLTATAPLDVLIVDDSAAIRKILQRVLRQTDLNLGEISEAGDGSEAVEILKNRTFGLILSDINMPQMDGLQLLARIKEMDHLRNVPVIMITTEGGQGKVMEAVQLGATGYVRKPFTADQIKEKLAGVIC
jgi:two-component system, chemotaxis family, chemotaxis protein CheY